MMKISIKRMIYENPGYPIVYIRTHNVIKKSRMSFINVFCFIERVLVNDINDVRLNK